MQTYPETQQSLTALLDRAEVEGELRIRRPDGQIFVLKSEQPSTSPFDIPSVDLGLTREEIVEFIHEGRRYSD